MHRVDHWFQRELFEKHGRRALEHWQSLPFFDLSSIDDETFISTEPGDLFDALPFEEFVLYACPSKSSGDQGFAYICDSGEFVRLSFVAPDAPANRLYVFDKKSREMRPETFTMKLALDEAGRTDINEAGVLASWLHDALSVAVSSLLLITRTKRHVVEVRPSRETKTRAKPWTREDLPRLILLTPQEAQRYQLHGGGTHASPHLHQRRGHWRELVSERFREKRRVWVRPTWVGKTEWEYRGATYAVVGAQQ